MEDKMISGARIILECLSRLGVKDIFGYPGGAVIPFYDELYNYKNLNGAECNLIEEEVDIVAEQYEEYKEKTDSRERQ